MKIIDRYIGKTILAAIALVTLMLIGLQLFILFVNQLSDIGKGNYGILQVMAYVFLEMPYQVYLFFPMASLLGCLIGLGMLANHRELVILRAAGMSIGQVTVSLLKIAFLVILFVTLLGETLIPQLIRLANDNKMQALSGGQSLRTSHGGTWLRSGDNFISIGVVSPGPELQEVYQYHFKPNHELLFARHIQQVIFQNRHWIARGVSQTLFQEKKTIAEQIAEMDWEITVNPALLGVGNQEPNEMNLLELHHYLKAKHAAHQAAPNYQLAYWQRLIQPLTTVVMMILAIPFIFGPLRSSTMGSKLLIGAAVGFGFYIANRFLGPISQLLQWPPVVAAVVPTCIFAILGIYLMQRAR